MIVLNDQVGAVMSVTEDIVATLRAQDHGHPPVICLEGNGSRPSHLGGGYSESGVMFTLNAVEHHAVVYSLEGHTIDRRSSQNGRGWAEGYVHTLNSTDHHAVCYRKSTKPGKGKSETWQEDTTTNTLNGFEFHSQVRTPEVVIYKKEETHDKDLPTSDMQLHPVHRV